jgi:hypothetical protein
MTTHLLEIPAYHLVLQFLGRLVVWKLAPQPSVLQRFHSLPKGSDRTAVGRWSAEDCMQWAHGTAGYYNPWNNHN